MRWFSRVADASAAINTHNTDPAAHLTTPPTSTPTGITQTIDWDDGETQVLDLESATGDVTVTFSNPQAGGAYILEVRQDSATPRDINWPANVEWTDGVTPVISVGANAVDIFAFSYNGTTYFGEVAANKS